LLTDDIAEAIDGLEWLIHPAGFDGLSIAASLTSDSGESPLSVIFICN